MATQTRAAAANSIEDVFVLGGHGSVDLIVDLKEELNEMKQKLDSAVADLWVLKLQVQKMKMDYVVVAAICVGVAIGCLMSKLF